MTNTPVTQIIEELDKRIADLESARSMTGKVDVLSPFTSQIRVMAQFREYALTMLPVEIKQNRDNWTAGLFEGVTLKEREKKGIPPKEFEDYFNKNYNQYAGE